MAGAGTRAILIAAVLALALPSRAATPAELGAASARGIEFLRREQARDGSWTALILASSVRYNLYTVFLYEYLGLIDAKRGQVDGLMEYVWSQRTPTGGLPGYPGAPDDIDLSVQAYLAARMAGESEDTPRMRGLAEAIRRMGGIGNVGATSKPYLWLFDLQATGQCAPAFVLEPLLGMDSKLPWIRVMAYPFAYLLGFDKVHPLPRDKYPFALQKPTNNHLCRLIPSVLRRSKRSKREFFEWVEAKINEDGTMFDYSPTTIPTLMALATEGDRYRGLIDRGIRALESFQAPAPRGIYQAPGEASVAETYLAVQTMIDLGVPHDDPVVRAGERYLLERMHPDTGGFGFSKFNRHFPDTDDTANAIATLHQLSVMRGDKDPHEPFIKGIDWLIAQQNEDGGFGTWEKDHYPWTRRIINRVKGAAGLVLAESVVEHTARVAITLDRFRALDRRYERAYRKAIAWLVKEQADDGGYSGTWFVNRLFGTAMVSAALATAKGDPRADRALAKAFKFVFSHQAADGGFSESPRSFETDTVVPLARSSPAQTGLIVSQVLWALENEDYRLWPALKRPIRKAVDFLARTQREDGRWGDGAWTGVTFPKIEYLIYPYVQDIEAIHAIGRYERAAAVMGE